MAARRGPPGGRKRTAFAASMVGQGAAFKRGRSAAWVPRAMAPRGRKADATGELKFHDVDLDDATVAATATVTPSINLIPQGVEEDNRIGRKCSVRNIGWRYDITLPTSGTIGRIDQVRVMLYLDKQANGATAAATDILASDDYQSFNNLTNKGRFRVLMDRTHDLKNHGAAGDGTTNDSSPDIVSGSFFKECNIPLEISGTGTPAITAIRSNNLGVLLISKAGVCTFDSKFRLRFSDS